MATRRKGWDQLSPGYQRRLLLGGIGPQRYARGESLAAARGHGSTTKENFVRRAKRANVKLTGADYDRIVETYGDAEAPDRLLTAIQEGRSGDKLPIQRLWQTQPLGAQKQWYWYH